jgi:heat shock protein HslJ
MQGSVRGYVLTAEELAVPDATIVIGESPGPVPDIPRVTDADGSFALDGLAAGRYLFRAFGPGDAVGESWVTVYDNSVSDVEIVLRPKALPGNVDRLAGTRWSATSYLSRRSGLATVRPATTLTLAFGAEGGVEGTGGCNSFIGEYQTSGPATIEIWIGGATEMACDEDVLAQEEEYLAALRAARSWRLHGRTLVLTRADGAVVALFNPLYESA